MFHHRVEAGRTTSLSHPSSRRRTSYDRYLLLQYDAPSFSNDPIPLPGPGNRRPAVSVVVSIENRFYANSRHRNRHLW
jgi:hypothetical protein